MIILPAKPTQKSSVRSPVTTLFVLLFGLVLLAFALHGTNWAALGALLAGSQPAPLGLAVASSAAALGLRCLRWHTLVAADRPVDPALVAAASTLGYAANYLLPARAGEVLRIGAVARATSISAAFLLATVVTERVLDAALLVAAACVALSILPAAPAWLHQGAWSAAVLALAGVLALLVTPWAGPLLIRLLSTVPLGSAWRARLTGLADSFVLGARSLHHPSRAIRYVLVSCAIWMLDIVGTLAVARALGLTMSPLTAVVLIVALALSSAVPSTPGSLGVFQYVAVTVLAPFHFAREQALALILLLQAVAYVVVLTGGAWGAWKLRHR